METALTIFLLFLGYELVMKNKKTKYINPDEDLNSNDKKEDFTDEEVFKIQNKFEEHVKQTYLPDAIGGRNLYIYRHLMNPWYQKLSGENRYDKEKIRSLKKDWVEYMISLEDEGTYGYLRMEFPDEKEKGYKEDWILASRKVFMIENAFASLIGKDAVKELEKTREMNFSSFTENGDIKEKREEV